MIIIAKSKKNLGYKIPFYRVNEMIKVPEVRVIFPDGSSQIMKRNEALQKAYDLNMDLVEIVSNANPPVCKIVEYDKFKYDLEKKLKESKKHQVTTVVKEIRLTSRISEHDYQTKLKHIKEFLNRKDKVKITIFFKGREVAHPDIGLNLAERLKNDLNGIGTLMNEPKLDGRVIALLFNPANSNPKKGVINGDKTKSQN